MNETLIENRFDKILEFCLETRKNNNLISNIDFKHSPYINELDSKAIKKCKEYSIEIESQTREDFGFIRPL